MSPHVSIPFVSFMIGVFGNEKDIDHCRIRLWGWSRHSG
jgi:hypothetical protein